MKKGMVVLIGAGPGDPGLITVKGREWLKHCDAVVYDELASRELLDNTKQGCQRIYVGKKAGSHSMSQEEINNLLISLATNCVLVVRLKGGDPFVFGRGGEEILALEKAGIPCMVIPGVTSAVAVPESVGIPVTHRGVARSFHVITAHTKGTQGGLPPDFDALARLTGTLVFLMGLGSLPGIVKGLLEAGRKKELPVAVIERGTLPGQRAVRGCLGDIVEKVEREGVSTPAIIVVGDCAALDLTRECSFPLEGVRIGVTGTPSFQKRLGAGLERMGGQVRFIGNMEIASYANTPQVQQMYDRLEKYRVLVFTSPNGVRLFFKGLMEAGKDIRFVAHMKFAVIGPGTALELKKHGFLTDYMPDTYNTDSLGRLLATECKEAPLLIARSEGGSRLLTEHLLEAGIDFEDVSLYNVTSTGQKETMDLEGLDYLTFASASGVNAFFEAEALNEESLAVLKRITAVCIGDVTAKALAERGRAADIMAGRYTADGMVEAICEHRAAKERAEKEEAQ